MASLNQCNFIGNITKDPETRFMPNGDAVCNFSIACNETYKDKNGQKQEKVEYVNIVMYRKLAEIAGEYLKKGAPVYISGAFRTRKWQNKEGQDRYSTEIVANEMQMLGGKSNQSNNDNDAPEKQDYSQVGRDGGFDDMADNIPF